MPAAKVSPVIGGLWALLRLIVAVIMAVIAVGITILAFTALVVANPGDAISGGGTAATATAIALAGVAIAVAIIVAPAIAALKAE